MESSTMRTQVLTMTARSDQMRAEAGSVSAPPEQLFDPEGGGEADEGVETGRDGTAIAGGALGGLGERIRRGRRGNVERLSRGDRAATDLRVRNEARPRRRAFIAGFRLGDSR